MNVGSESVDLLSFNHVNVLEFESSRQYIYQVFYDNSTIFLLEPVNNEPVQLFIDQNGEIHIDPSFNLFWKKIKAFVRLVGKENLLKTYPGLLRINETDYLIDKLTVENSEFLNSMRQQLYQYVDSQISKRDLPGLYLDQVIGASDFINSYMLSNLGHPEDSSNYYNKLQQTIHYVIELTNNLKIDTTFYTLSLLAKISNSKKAKTILVEGNQESIIIKNSHIQTENNQFSFKLNPNKTKNINNTLIIPLTNDLLDILINEAAKFE